MKRKEENDKGVAGSEEADRKHEEWNIGLRETLQEQSDKLEEGEKNGKILGKLYEKDIIDHEGNLL